jgi:ribonucleoside-diphosphate reductase beta chain
MKLQWPKSAALTTVRDSHSGDTPIWHERAKSLAIFSAFTEGVNLFSSFAVLLSFKLDNKLKRGRPNRRVEH